MIDDRISEPDYQQRFTQGKAPYENQSTTVEKTLYPSRKKYLISRKQPLENSWLLIDELTNTSKADNRCYLGY